ncbi:GDSL esterase/lipase [Hibiscus syriacus]|uniref:GDSL esterase/lipase n=1 Tax=Hibiscus syriacus TaxID=106335 RepID=A0A6A2ZA05_HIBSY|nr:GDSL esterase/lipase [Hibiscus syriacus]
MRGSPQVPCYFIFGDSLVDNGNNNRLSSLAKANYLPNGIDFPNGPTGRFSNGKTTVDVIAQLLGFDNYIPPYWMASGRQILGGVNYASAATGIRDRPDSNCHGISKCIYSIGLGSNDYLNNYFMSLYYSSSTQYTPEQFADVLIQEYTQQLQIGCSPNELDQNSPNGRTCVKRINAANRMFNDKLKGLVDQFNNTNSDAKFYINAYGIFQDITSNPSTSGLKVANAGCCEAGRKNGQITCFPAQTPCPNRKEYLFWDVFHPTEAAYMIVGRRAYSAQVFR